LHSLDTFAAIEKRPDRGTLASTGAINPALLPILRQWRNDCPASDEALVFPSARGFMRQKDRDYGFKAALTGAECHAVTCHGLRHTFASHFMMSGGNILTLQKLLGHSSVAVTMKYAHLAPDFMRDEIARLRFERPTATVTNLVDRQSQAS
jgi:integrase